MWHRAKQRGPLRRIAVAVAAMAVVCGIPHSAALDDHGPTHAPVAPRAHASAAVGAGAAAPAREARESPSAQLRSLGLERDGDSLAVRIELDRSVVHRLERGGAAELAVVLDDTRLAVPLPWVDLRGTPLRHIDVRRGSGTLRVMLGLDPAQVLAVQSAMIEPETGAVLIVRLTPQPEPEAATTGSFTKRESGTTADEAYFDALRRERAGYLSEAEARLRATLADEPEHAAARARLVHLLTARGETAEALRVLRAARGSGDGGAASTILEARLLLEEGAEDEAIAVLEAALPHAAEDAELHAFLGALVQRRGDHERALALFQHALATDPSRATWWLGRALSLDAKSERAETLAALRRAMALRGLVPEARVFAERRAKQLAAALVTRADAPDRGETRAEEPSR
jgi:Flp pilus assembly protein TadD